MDATDKQFAGSIPELYQRLLVPMIFEPYAEDLAGRIAALRPGAVLETAAGTGALTRALSRRLPASARIVATDLNPPMLTQAAALMPSDERVAWQQGDALSLPFEDGSFDVVACQFGVMFFPDRVRGYREARRVLKPGGHWLFNVWGGISDNDFAEVVGEAAARVFPDDPPRFFARTPYGHHDADRIRGELAEAGFGRVSVDALQRRSRASSPREAAVAFCQGTPLRNDVEARDASRLEAVTAAATDALTRRFGSGPIEGRIYAIIFQAEA